MAQFKEDEELLDENTTYANWNNYYVSLYREQDIVSNLMFQTNTNINDKTLTAMNLSILYSKIKLLELTYSIYIDNHKKNKELLEKLFIQLRNPKYLSSLKNQNDVFQYQLNILLILEDIWENINVSLSLKGLNPKTETRSKHNPNNASRKME
jgi:hypothetical protein